MAKRKNQATVRLRVLSPIQHDGELCAVGSEIELELDQAEPLIGGKAARALAPRLESDVSPEQRRAVTAALAALQGYLGAAELDPRVQAVPAIAALANDLYHSMHDPEAFLRPGTTALGLSRIARQVRSAAAARSTAVARERRGRESSERRSEALKECCSARARNPALQSDSSVAKVVAESVGVSPSTIRRWLAEERKLRALPD